VRRHAIVLWLAAAGLTSALAAADPAPKPAPAASPAPAAKPAAGPIRLEPKGRRLSTYTLRARYEMSTKDVTFEAPPAYQEGFAFWTGRMKGNKRMEIFEFQTITQDVNANGEIPFRTTLPRYNMEMERGGRPYAPYGPLIRDVTSLSWEGTMDAGGLLKEIRPVTTSANKEIEEIALEQVQHVFPVLAGPRDIPAGGGFTDVITVPFPSRLNVKGLENIQLQITRDFRLLQVRGDRAEFEQTVTYALSPKTPPDSPGTTCVIGGGGRGEMTFDLRRGVFNSSSARTVVTVDIEAPLRPLPGAEPSAGPPGTAKTRIELEVMISGDQAVARVWGEEED
jgi:hypothetical protein